MAHLGKIFKDYPRSTQGQKSRRVDSRGLAVTWTRVAGMADGHEEWSRAYLLWGVCGYPDGARRR